MSKLLLEEEPLIVLPTLAKLLGLNESIVLQQLNYWLRKSNNIRDGRKWVYNTYKEWQEQFPFWSEVTVRRTLTSLENKGIIITANYNEMKADKTKWYTIDQEKLEGMISPCDQNDQSMCSNRSDGCDQNDQSNTREYTENTTEKKEEEEEKAQAPKPNPIVFFEQNFGVVSPIIAEDIYHWLDGNYFDEPDLIVIEAMKVAVRNGVRKWIYANRVLIDWSDRKLRTLRQVQSLSLETDRKIISKTSTQESIRKPEVYKQPEPDTDYNPDDDPELKELLAKMKSAEEPT